MENIVKRMLCLAVALGALLALYPRPAAADGLFGLFRGDPTVTAAGIAVGAGSIGAYYAIKPKHHVHRAHGFTSTGALAITTVGCMAVAPIVGAAWVDMTQHRELTSREAIGLVADCVVPVLGSMFWNAQFDAHPEWERKAVRR